MKMGSLEINEMSEQEVKELIGQLKSNLEDRKKLKNYYVTFEVSGSVCVPVQAHSEEEAKQIAEDEWYPEDVNYDVTDVYAEEIDAVV